MGNTKLIFLLVISIALIFYGISLILDEDTVQGIDRTELENMSEEELVDLVSFFVADWNYKELIKNIDDYKGKIIGIRGTVTESSIDDKIIVICIDGKIFCETYLGIVTKEIYLKGDKINGYVEVIDSNQIVREVLGVNMGNISLIATQAIQLFCTNCNYQK